MEEILNKNKITIGHLSALLTIIIWGTTFISTKILLRDFSPLEILFFRFIIGYLALFLIYPHILKPIHKEHELYFALAGLCGITLYFLLENIALNYTLASNVGVIISIAPFFTAIFAQVFLNDEKLYFKFFIGFTFSIVGILLITFNNNMILKLNPIGDVLAILSSIIWAIYSIITKKISSFHYNTIQTTRRTFFYGILFMIPTLSIFNFKLDLNSFKYIPNLLNIMYLGFGASALCFVTWNLAVKFIGAVKTSIYIYMVPVITILTSVIILHEKITFIALAGTFLTLAGLFISQAKISFKVKEKIKWMTKI